MIKSWIGFGDLDLIFKVIVRLNPLKLSQNVFAYYLVNHWMECYKFANLYKSDRINSLSDFGDLDLIFKVTASWLKLPP